MKKIKKSILCFILSLVVVSGANLQCFEAFALSENEFYGSSGVKTELYFGRNTLLKMENGKQLVEVYDTLYNGINERREKIVFSGFKSGRIAYDDFTMVYELYRFDHPEHYWYSGGYGYSLYSDGTLAYILPSYGDGFDDTLFTRSVNLLLACANGKTTDYDKALALHDAIVKYSRYTDGDNAHNAYGITVNGEAVCEGYAKAYQYLLQLSGIQSYIVTGFANGGAHAWNLIRLDGRYYYADTTWDDPVTDGYESLKPVYYRYFCTTTELISKNHTIEDKYGIIPECTSTDKLYKEYREISEYTVESVANAFGGTYTARFIYTKGDGLNFDNWFSERDENGMQNLDKVYQKLFSYRGGSFSWSSDGEAIILSFIPANTASVAGRLKNFSDPEKAAQISLIPSGSSETAYTAEVYGDFDIWKINGVAYGNYSVVISKQGHKTKTGSVTVNENGAVFDSDIFLIGDTNEDGTVDVRDIVRLKVSIAAGITSDALDVDSDGSVNAQDIVYLFENIY